MLLSLALHHLNIHYDDTGDCDCGSKVNLREGRLPRKVSQEWKDKHLTTVIAVLRLTQEWEGFLERFPKNGRVGRLPGKVL